MWEFDWWSLYKTFEIVKKPYWEKFPYRRAIKAEQLPEDIRKGSFFGYVHCDIEVPENLRANFGNFSSIFKNILVSKNDIGNLMIAYAEEKGILPQSRKMLISSFTLQKGTLITPLLFLLTFGIVCPKRHRFVASLSTLHKSVSTASYSQQ